jgi:hypothetical protein
MCQAGEMFMFVVILRAFLRRSEKNVFGELRGDGFGILGLRTYHR